MSGSNSSPCSHWFPVQASAGNKNKSHQEIKRNMCTWNCVHFAIPCPSREELRTTGDPDWRQRARTKMATPEQHESTRQQTGEEAK